MNSIFSLLIGKLKIRIILLSILILSLSSHFLFAQEKISFVDSLTFHTPPWYGNLDAFHFSGNALKTKVNYKSKEKSPSWITHSMQCKSSMTWQGQISFHLASSLKKQWSILLFPFEEQTLENQKKKISYIALDMDASGILSLVFLSLVFSQDQSVEKHVDLSIIRTSSLKPFSPKSKYTLQWKVVLKNSNTWEFFLSKPNSIHSQLKKMGEIKFFDPTTPIQKPHWGIVTSLGKDAKSFFALETFEYYYDKKEKDNNFFLDLTQDGNDLIVSCLNPPNIDNASIQLLPSQSKLQTSVEENTIRIHPETDLDEGKYTLSLSFVKDNLGNIIPPKSFYFVLEDDKKTTDDNSETEFPLFSEIMICPQKGASEYIEVFNPYKHPINLNQYAFAKRNEGRIGRLYPLSESTQTIKAKSYIVITPWKDGVSRFFDVDPNSIIETKKFPSLPNSRGEILLVHKKSGKTLEELIYSLPKKVKKKDLEGCALERISFQKPSADPQNWLFVTPQQGYGSPTKENKNTQTSPCNTLLTDKDVKDPLTASIFILQQEQSNDLQVKLSLFSLTGDCLAQWNKDEALQICKKIQNQRKASILSLFPQKRGILHFEVQVVGKTPKYQFSFLLQAPKF